ncbi:MAG TPA: hypothetical protein VLT83_10250 [Opitutaceae bacterium]|nr:hypothetical protein [Opitutaceae bacterium]
MDWLLNHPQVLFLIVIAVVAMLQKLKQAHSQDAAGRGPATSQEDEERTRRIQEEIRRRIRERRGLAPAAPPPRAGDHPVFPPAPPMIEEVRPVVVPPPLPVEDVTATAGLAAEYERQQKMLQQLQAIKAARQTSTSVAPAAAAAAPAAAPVAVGHFVADLRNPAGLRRAIVLREILGPPVGLR